MTLLQNDHTVWMREALLEARKAFNKDEVPIGAVVVYENRIIGRGHNLVETLQDPAAHAEMLAINAAANSLASWRLEDCILYTTLEPCMMCAGAILLSRMPVVVYGAKDPRYGACGTRLQIMDNEDLDVQAGIVSGILEDECGGLIKEFFNKVRQRSL